MIYKKLIEYSEKAYRLKKVWKSMRILRKTVIFINLFHMGQFKKPKKILRFFRFLTVLNLRFQFLTLRLKKKSEISDY